MSRLRQQRNTWRKKRTKSSRTDENVRHFGIMKLQVVYGKLSNSSQAPGYKRTAGGGREKKNCLFTYATKQTLMAIKFSRNKTPCKSLKAYNILWIKMTCYYVERIFVIFELCVISSKACFGSAGKHRWLSRQVVTTEVTSWPGSANFQGIQHVLGSEILLRSLCTYHETKCFFLRNLNFFSSTHRKRAIPRNLGNFFTDFHNNQHGGQRTGRGSSSSFYILLTTLLLP